MFEGQGIGSIGRGSDSKSIFTLSNLLKLSFITLNFISCPQYTLQIVESVVKCVYNIKKMIIQPYEKNAKEHPDKQIKLLAKVVKEVGWRQNVEVNQQGVIVAGHGRYLTWEKYKDEYKLPDVWVTDDTGKTIMGKHADFPLTPDQEKMWRMADNQLNAMTGVDMNLILPELKELPEELQELTGFDSDLVIEPEEKDDEVPEIPEEPKSKLGDLYELGQHRLLCGDSTDSDSVAKLMNGEKADMAHNDPPYGMKKEKDGVLNDNLNFNDLLNFNREWIALQFSHLKDNGSWYCWGIDEPLMDIYSEIIKPYIKEQKATFRNLITWDKGNGQGQNSENTRSYAIADEKCLFVMCGVQGFNNNADNYFDGWEPIRDYLLEQRLKAGWDVPTMKRIAGHSDLSRDHWTCKSQWNMPTIDVYKSFQKYCIENNIDAFKKEYEELKKEYEELKKEYYSTRAYFNNVHDNFNNVWHFDRHIRKGDEGGHATPKPIPLCERAIKSSCPDNGLILDFFLGSGSTMVAAHQLNRKCYGMELDPKYVDVIVQRYVDYTGNNKIKKNGVEVTWNKKV